MKCLKVCVSTLLAISMACSVPAEAAVNWSEAAVNMPEAAGQDPAGGSREEGYAEGEAIILYQESASLARSSITAKGLGTNMQIEETYEFDSEDTDISARVSKNSREDVSRTLKVSLVKSDTYSTEEMIEQLGARKDILAAEPNYRIHILEQGQDPYAKFQWAIDNQGQNHGTQGLDVNPEQGILGANPDGEESVIALVDTGIDYTHEDLKNVVWNNPIHTNQLRGGHGYDFINQDTDPMDDNGHGSHCAGIMAAEYNNAGIRGIVKNSKTKIMALKVLDEEGSGYGMETVAAYNYIYKAQQMGVNVVAVNNSWGGQSEEESVIFKTLIELVGEKGAVSVCASGNDGADNDMWVQFPAGIDSEYVLSVAASNENDELAAFSNYGAETVDLAAPGADILSTVSYDCFNPGLYEEPNELCSMFENFSDGRLVQKVTADDGEIAYGYGKDNGKAKVSLALTDEAYFGLKSDAEKSLKWTINGAKSGETYMIYFPYTAGKSNTATHDSIMVKAVGPDITDEEDSDFSAVLLNDLQMTEDGVLESKSELELLFDCINGADVDKGNYWNHFSGLALLECEEPQKRALAVTLIVSADGDYELYLDNMGVSKENVASDKFGKYDYYNGTSMATPYVTGAVAAVAGAYPQEDARDRKEHILGCTRKSASLSDKMVTGGVLDLSKVAMPNAYIRNISLDGNQNIRIEGRCLSDAKVSVNNKEVMPKKQSESEIVLDSTGLLDKFLDITVAVAEKTMNKKCFLASGSGFDSAGRTEGIIGDGFVVSDGEQIYYVDSEGMVCTCMPDRKDELGNIFWMDEMAGYSPQLFGVDERLVDEDVFSISNLSEVIYLDSRLWTVLKLDMKYSEERILACYDDEEGWKAASKLPEEFENLEGISIAPYQGKLYLLGGMDNITGDVKTIVMQMDTLTLKWEAGAELPEARAFAKAVPTGDKLIVTLGKNQQDTFPHNMVFDGKSWSVSKAELGNPAANAVYSYYNPNMERKEIPYYYGWVGAVKEGLVYAGLEVENLGDTFFYRLSSAQYAAADYAVSNTSLEEDAYMHAVVMQDKFYLLAQEKEGSHIFSMPVQSPCIEVTAPDMSEEDLEKGSLTGIRHYMPGDVISLTAEPEMNYFVKQFMVDGKKVAKGPDGKYRYRAAVNMTKSKISVSAEFGAYVSYLELEEDLSLYPGQEYYIMLLVYPENADNQKIIWSFDKPGVVSVDKSGMLKVSTKAKPGNTVVVTATAADRKEIKASCTITVTSAPLPEKNEVYYKGKYIYKVTASSAKKKTVSCMGFSGKEVAGVSIPSAIKISGYTFKVTGIASNAFAKSTKIKSVTVGKNVTSISQGAFQGCKSLTSIKIKGTSLKTVGKNAFKGVSKKAVVRVPKKKKKSYTSILKRSGYSGKVK